MKNTAHLFKAGHKKLGGRKKGSKNKKTIFLENASLEQKETIRRINELFLKRILETQQNKNDINQGKTRTDIAHPVSDDICLKFINGLPVAIAKGLDKAIKAKS